MLASNQYTFRHNQISKYVHLCILKDLGVTVSIGDDIIMWDVAIATDKI